MNRPDAGPQPQHAIERHGEGWTDPAVQVVSGAFAVEERTDESVTLRRRSDYSGWRSGNVAEVELYQIRRSPTCLPDYEPLERPT